MIRRSIAGLLLAATPAFAMLQAPDAKDQDIGSMLSGKKPCDADKKSAEAQPTPTPSPTPQAQNQAVQGMISLGAIPADKQEPPKKSLGALPGPMEGCK